MKSIFRLIALLFLCGLLAGSLSSCAIFEKSSPTELKSFKHKKPLPKKWIVNNGSTPSGKYAK